jgi:hypothetical protein
MISVNERNLVDREIRIPETSLACHLFGEAITFRTKKRDGAPDYKSGVLRAGCGLLQDALDDGFEVVRGKQIFLLE